MRAAVAIGAVFVAWAMFTVSFFPALDRATGRERAVPAAVPAPVAPGPHWTRRPVPCFFVGAPHVRDPRACGDVRVARWDAYCNTDPGCMEFPDGTNYVTGEKP